MAGQRTCLAFFMQGELLYKVILVGLLAEMERKDKAADIARLEAWDKAHPDAWRKRQERYYAKHPERVRATRSRYNRTDKAKLRLKRYAELHPDRIAQTQRNYTASEHGKARDRRWKKSNPEKVKSTAKAWRENNPEKVKAHWRAAGKRRFSTPRGKMIVFARGRIRDAIATSGKSMPASASKMIGCGWSELKCHLESQFVEGMTWENYGPVWHVDHKTPIASFDLNDPKQVEDAFNFKNLQPLLKSDNLRKGAKLNYVLQPTTTNTPTP